MRAGETPRASAAWRTESIFMEVLPTDLARSPSPGDKRGRRCDMLYCNFFADGGALLETAPQGDASTPVKLSEASATVIEGLLDSEQVSAALARLYLAGAHAGERSAHGFIAAA